MAPAHGTTECPFRPSEIRQPYVLGTSACAYPVNDPNGFAPRFHLTVVGQIPLLEVVSIGGNVAANDPFTASLMSNLTDAGYYPGGFFQRFPPHPHDL